MSVLATARLEETTINSGKMKICKIKVRPRFRASTEPAAAAAAASKLKLASTGGPANTTIMFAMKDPAELAGPLRENLEKAEGLGEAAACCVDPAVHSAGMFATLGDRKHAFKEGSLDKLGEGGARGEIITAFPCAPAAVLPKAHAFACGASGKLGMKKWQERFFSLNELSFCWYAPAKAAKGAEPEMELRALTRWQPALVLLSDHVPGCVLWRLLVSVGVCLPICLSACRCVCVWLASKLYVSLPGRGKAHESGVDPA